jgi:diadenylate cyclase
MHNPFLDIGILDLFDILFVAVLFYTAIVWLRSTRAAFIVRGLFTLVAIYIVARQLDLQLTAWIFQGFFAIFLIMVVVIFQEELRQIFERIALWSLGGKTSSPLHSDAADILLRTLADLARDKIGALVVVCGKAPIGRHLSGGIESGSKLSEPILRSIFDPHSPGHDGAVIIEGDRITRFAAHLPLSKDVRQLANVGTRHSAALGLSELTDAFCIVVSEERGQISIARDGRLRPMENFQELAALLQEYLDEKYPSPVHRRISIELLRQNWLAKAAGLGLAIGLWYVFVPGSKNTEITYEVPVELRNLPQQLALERVQPPEIKATFTGPRRAFYLFDSRKLKVSVDASLAELGRRTFRLSDENIRHPPDLTLQALEPSTLQISVTKVVTRDGEKNPTVAPEHERN